MVVRDGLLVVCLLGGLVVLLDEELALGGDDFFLAFSCAAACWINASLAPSLQNGVVQRHALMFEEPGSEMSLRLHSSSAVKGLSIGPSNTLVGKHSRSTAKNKDSIFISCYSISNFTTIYLYYPKYLH